jgi:hypothetical protein
MRHFPKLSALVFAQFIALIEIHVAAKAQGCDPVIRRFDAFTLTVSQLV